VSYPPPPPNSGQPGPYGQQGPYGQPAPYGQFPVPPKKKGKGCLIAALVVLAVLLVLCGVGGFFVWKLYDTVKDSVPGIGGAECPTEDEVSDLVGYDVELKANANIVVAAGCIYSGSGVGVSITEGAGVIADDEIGAFRTEAQDSGTEAEPIDVGDDGLAFGSPQRSQAITKSDGTVVEVEIFGENGQDIGNKFDEAVELLETFIDLQ
jgi:hypothetical protein